MEEIDCAVVGAGESANQDTILQLGTLNESILIAK